MICLLMNLHLQNQSMFENFSIQELAITAVLEKEERMELGCQKTETKICYVFGELKKKSFLNFY